MENILSGLQSWSIDHGIKILIIIAVTYFVSKFSKIAIKRAVEKLVISKGDMSKEAEEMREETLYRIFTGTITTVLWIVVAMMILSEFGVDIGPLIAGAGVIGLAVGFGGQYLVRDVVTGLFIILENQYRVGDSIEVSGLSGKVEDISLRATILRDLNGIVHHIPHGEITTVSNKSKGFSRINVDVGIGYGANIDKAIEVINRIGEEMFKDKNCCNDLVEAPYFLRVEELADSAVVLKVVGDVRPSKQFVVAGEFRKRIKEEFDKEGIEIPFQQMVVHKPAE